MKSTLFPILLIFILNNCFSQNFTHDFGKYSNEEFAMQKYENDNSAEAVVIYDIGKSYFTYTDDGYLLIYERQTKIKIFTKAGLKYAQWEIPFYEKDDKAEFISELKGNTYNFESGTVKTTALNEKNSYIEKEHGNWKVLKFAMPDVKEGSIVEVKYEIRTPYFFNFRSWEFQNKIPVIYSEYNTRMVPFYEYTYIMQGAKKFDDFKTYEDGITHHVGSVEYRDKVYMFVMKNIPAFKDESYITSINDYIMKLDFQLCTYYHIDGYKEEIMTTWPNMIEELLKEESFGDYLKSSQKKTKKIIDAMHLTSLSALEKAKFLDKYVKSNYSYNNYYDKYTSQNPKNFLKTKVGNSADINLFYTGLLNNAGIEAYPLVLSTREHGKIKLDYPFDHFFNYVLIAANIDNQWILLDGTESLSKFSEIPSKTLNDKGLLIKKDKNKPATWLNITSSTISNNKYNIEIYPKIGQDSTSVNISINPDGYEALNIRNDRSNNFKYIKKDITNPSLILTDSIQVSNINETDSTLKITYNAKMTADNIDNKILISPFCNLSLTENPFKMKFRDYPVDMMYKKQSSFTTTIHIHDGFELFSKPENLSISNENINIIYACEKTNNNTLKIRGSYFFKKDIYGISSYFDLKDYLNKIIQKFNEKIVLIKSTK